KFEISNSISKISLGAQLRGAGIRAFVAGAWAFAHVSDFTSNGMKKTGQQVAKTALALRDRVAEKFDLSGPRFQDKIRMNVKQKFIDVPLEEKMALVRMLDDEAHDVDRRIINTQTIYRDLSTQLYIANSFGTSVWVENSLPRILLKITSKENGIRQRAWGESAGRGGFEVLDEIALRKIARESAELAIDLLNSKAVPGGIYDAILDPRLNAAMVHEAFGHPCEADSWIAQNTVLEGLLGHPVGPEFLSIVDDPTMPRERGSFEYDWEGTKTLKRSLVKAGILTELMHNLETAARMESKPNGAARCQSFMYPPIPRMSNTYMEPGDWDVDELISDTREGILLCDWNYGYTDHAKGQFMFQASYGYLIEKGEKTQIIRDVSLAGQIIEFLHKIDALGNKLGMSAGTCGKGEQMVPDNSGGPHVRVLQVPVGGM
ncbi:MAG: TldD/PmbA family protein, partial [Candidatus Thorarchaeota archaeon]